MTTPSDSSDKNSFSAFAIGLTIGVIGALAFGTEDGRKVVKKLIDSLPEKYRKPPVSTTHSPSMVPVIPLEETAHHAVFDQEAPPPPPPSVRPTRPEPFTPSV